MESAKTAIDSGSRSWATVAFGPKIRIPGPRGTLLKAVKVAVLTSRPIRSITVTEPSGSSWAIHVASPIVIAVRLPLVGRQHPPTVRRRGDEIRQRARWDARDKLKVGVE